ncbi:hypothetical protein ANCDUO_25500 [Ancylostoma duodenale]|uniref:Uncharacterized protein n=1 Tax=Ancylostoma duodenale TaxID=51022 RepID=A0A0C2FCN9_9BILA|nr:hypothetical protein ANCDUO_25500 [Ancylostoma duodenale]
MIRNILLSCVICTEILIASDTKTNHVSGVTDLHKEQKYSFPPNNTPISKVYVFGRPVYVREPFVVPQRDNHRRIHDNNVQRDERSFRGAEAVGDAVEQALAQESLVRDVNFTLIVFIFHYMIIEPKNDDNLKAKIR